MILFTKFRVKSHGILETIKEIALNSQLNLK